MSLPSDDDLDDTLPGPSHSTFSHSQDVDADVASLLQSLRLDEVRRRPVTDNDDQSLKRVHERIHDFIRMETDHDRRKRSKKAHTHGSRIREELYNLRRVYPGSSAPHKTYFDRIQPVIQDVVTDSFDEEYRKVAIALGLVDALAELIILEVYVHGTTPRFPEHKSIRKLIANALTNLTFGHGPSKKRLCSYPDFIPTVVKIFREAKNLVQVYAGLIRNLSWMADSEMTACLNPCVSALAAAAVEARKASDECCVRAILSALWNLASHSNESKKAICDQPGCLQMLASVLTSCNNPIVDIESASGILKYVSQYLINHSDHMDLRVILAKALILHLNSSSFTALSNVLGALGNLIAKDPHVQNEIRCDVQAMRQLNSLRDSAREDVSNPVKGVLQYLNQGSVYNRKPYNNMSASLGVSPYNPPRDRILMNRAVLASPGHPSPMAVPQFASPAVFLDQQQRCSSLPRHFARGGFAASPHGQMHPSPQFRPQPFPPPTMFLPQPSDMVNYQQQMPIPVDNFIQMPLDDEEEDRMSQTANKSNSSRRSLESELPSGWNSMPESVNTTANLSPVSPSELPDSPTHYSRERQEELRRNEEHLRNEEERLKAQGLIPKSFNSNGSDLSKNEGSDAATAVIEDFPTPTFPPYAGSSPGRSLGAHQENDYATLDTTAQNLLQLSIESALPPATPRTSKRQKSPLDNAQLLAETIQSAMPKKQSRVQGSERLLQDCIQSAMPSPSMGSTLSKNVNGGRCHPVTSMDRLESQGHPFAESHLVTSSVLFSTEEGSFRDATRLLGQDEQEESESDDEFGHEPEDDVDTSLPLDCLEEEEVTIDCSSLQNGKQPRSRPEVRTTPLKPSRLPKPTYRPGVSPRIKPPVKPKPQTQAVISPYNYQKPKNPRPSPESKPVSHSGVNTLLITTV